MKKLIVVAAIMGISSVYAAQELKFGDVNYFLKEGQFNLSADLSSTYYKETVENSDTLETRGYLVETRYGYGINDQLNIYIGLDYAFDREVENKTTTTDADYSQDGLANPILAANYRLLNQNESRYNFDLGAITKINVEDAETGDANGQESNDGNFSSGRNSIEVNARMGRKWDIANEWQLAAGVVYYNSGEETILNTSGDIDVDIDSSTDFFLKATYQYRPVNEFMMSLSAQATQVGELSGDVGSSRITDDAHVDMDFLFRAKYLITDSFIANFHYGMSRNANYDRDADGVMSEIKKRRENFYGVGVDLLF